MDNGLILRRLYSRIVKKSLTHRDELLPGGVIAEIASMLNHYDPVGEALRDHCDGAIVRTNDICRLFINGKLSSFLGDPSEYEFNPDGSLECLLWHDGLGRRHRTDGPAMVRFMNSRILSMSWYVDGALQSTGDQPAVITYGLEEEVIYKAWFNDGVPHRTGDLPAKIYYVSNGTQVHAESYYIDGVIHRDGDKPATIIRSRIRREVVVHEAWIIRGEVHRENLSYPSAITYTEDGLVCKASWYLFGELFAVEQF
jgi:hypothetical protein